MELWTKAELNLNPWVVSHQGLCAISVPRGKRGTKPSRPDWTTGWSERLTRDVADNSLTEKGWCHQFSGLGLAALDSVPWIQQKTVETNLWLLYSNKKFFFFVFFSQNPNFFLPLFSFYLNTNICNKLGRTISLQQALSGAQGSLHPGPDCLISW